MQREKPEMKGLEAKNPRSGGKLGTSSYTVERGPGRLLMTTVSIRGRAQRGLTPRDLCPISSLGLLFFLSHLSGKAPSAMGSRMDSALFKPLSPPSLAPQSGAWMSWASPAIFTRPLTLQNPRRRPGSEGTLQKGLSFCQGKNTIPSRFFSFVY
jgi:hypothetical protein